MDIPSHFRPLFQLYFDYIGLPILDIGKHKNLIDIIFLTVQNTVYLTTRNENCF